MPKEQKSVFKESLNCGVISLDYNFMSKEMKLYLASGNFCNMAGTIAMATAIDKDIIKIQTFIDGVLDMCYLLNGEWSSILPNKQ